MVAATPGECSASLSHAQGTLCTLTLQTSDPRVPTMIGNRQGAPGAPVPVPGATSYQNNIFAGMCSFVKIHYIGQRISNRCLKNIHIRDIDGKEFAEREINATSVFISMMPMNFIFGFTKNDLQEKKLRPIKDAFIASRSDVHEDHRRRRGGVIKR